MNRKEYLWKQLEQINNMQNQTADEHERIYLQGIAHQMQDELAHIQKEEERKQRMIDNWRG